MQLYAASWSLRAAKRNQFPKRYRKKLMKMIVKSARAGYLNCYVTDDKNFEYNNNALVDEWLVGLGYDIMHLDNYLEVNWEDGGEEKTKKIGFFGREVRL